MKILFLCLGMISVAFLSSCKKEVRELPAATEAGKNTFGCKLDDKFWVPAKFGFLSTKAILEARRFPEGQFYINARNFSSSPVETEFEFFIKKLTEPGTYLLNTDVVYPNTNGNYVYYVKRNVTPQDEWITSTQYGGFINITKIDTINEFVSGTFQFSAINSSGDPHPITVTEGRFDVSTKR